ncbi:hypothetical protein BC629DRAFT_518759 [Irpex lacteus]|nr:hypothetical protein BC629DRAFT_518759 [Irpex lacteus]
MKMDGGWEDYFHFNLLGELLKISRTRKRWLTYAINTCWAPFRWTQRTRFRKALWKASLYWTVTLLRLLYMLIAMTYNMWLLLATVTTLAMGQFIIEYIETPDFASLKEYVPTNPPSAIILSQHANSSALSTHSLERVKEPLLDTEEAYDSAYPLHPYGVHEHANDEYPYRLSSSTDSTSSLPRAHPSSPGANIDINPETSFGRPRSKSKPDAIWIHPTESNIARADARAIQLGLIEGDTDLVRANQLPSEGETAWEVGKGRDVAGRL